MAQMNRKEALELKFAAGDPVLVQKRDRWGTPSPVEHDRATGVAYCDTANGYKWGVPTERNGHAELDWVAIDMDNASQEQLLRHFTALCHLHDITFDYSDDGRAWNAGRAEQLQIVAVGRRIADRAAVVAAYNKAVDDFLVPDARERFHRDESFWN